MNERIQELAEDAEYDLQRFSNSIIQSCIAQVALIGLHNIENPDIRWAIERAMDNIREHFGVGK